MVGKKFVIRGDWWGAWPRGADDPKATVRVPPGASGEVIAPLAPNGVLPGWWKALVTVDGLICEMPIYKVQLRALLQDDPGSPVTNEPGVLPDVPAPEAPRTTEAPAVHPVALPDKDELVKNLRQLLDGLNRQDRRMERWAHWRQRRGGIPPEQLQDRAVQIAQWLIALPTPNGCEKKQT